MWNRSQGLETLAPLQIVHFLTDEYLSLYINSLRNYLRVNCCH